MSYEDSLKAAGAEILACQYFGSYQGDLDVDYWSTNNPYQHDQHLINTPEEPKEHQMEVCLYLDPCNNKLFVGEFYCIPSYMKAVKPIAKKTIKIREGEGLEDTGK